MQPEYRFRRTAEVQYQVEGCMLYLWWMRMPLRKQLKVLV